MLVQSMTGLIISAPPHGYAATFFIIIEML